MNSLIYIFLGGGIGSVLRYLLKVFCEKNISIIYPYGTFFANIIGCLFLGFVTSLCLNKTDLLSTNARLFLTVGIAGGFTTFSTFSLESFELIKQGSIFLSIAYMTLSLLLGVLAIYAGIFFARQF